MRASGFEGGCESYNIAASCASTEVSQSICPSTGAKTCCAPHLHEDPTDKEKVFDGLLNGTLGIYSSDHAPTNYYDANGKQLGLTKNPGKNVRRNFRYIPNGLPGVETKGPLLWSEGVCKGRMTVSKLYGVYPQKGAIQPGSDANLIIWRPAHIRKSFTLRSDCYPHCYHQDGISSHLTSFLAAVHLPWMCLCNAFDDVRRTVDIDWNRTNDIVDFGPLVGIGATAIYCSPHLKKQRPSTSGA